MTDVLTKLDELSDKAKGHEASQTINEAIQLIESQRQQIDHLQQNLETSREVWKDMNELLAERGKQIEAMMKTLNNLA